MGAVLSTWVTLTGTFTLQSWSPVKGFFIFSFFVSLCLQAMFLALLPTRMEGRRETYSELLSTLQTFSVFLLSTPHCCRLSTWWGSTWTSTRQRGGEWKSTAEHFHIKMN